MLVTLSGIVTFVRAQTEKASSAMLVRLVLIVTQLRL